MANKFKVGDIVVVGNPMDGNELIINKTGRILKVRSFDSLIEFDKHINGHYGNLDARGKDGHCWWVDNQFIKLHKINKKVLVLW